MQALFSHLSGLLKMSGQASILILLVLAAQWVCGRRLQPRWRCALWLLVLLRLALPWKIPSATSLFNVVKLPAAANRVQPETVAAPMIDVPVSDAKGVAIPVASSRGAWLALAWVAGALLLSGGAAVNHYKIHRRVAQLRPFLDGPTLNLLEDCKALMGVRVPITLIETEVIESPALFGFVRPRLLLPAGLAVSFTPHELRHVFLHELAHIKRHDVLTGWVMLGLQALHWFNPLVWLAFHCLRADREQACDALALSHAWPGENESYGLTIVKLLERFSQSVWAPSLAGILETKQQMKERISMIAKFQKTDRGLALAVCLFAGLALVTLTDAQNAGHPATSGSNGSEAASKAQNQKALELAKAESSQSENEWNLEEKLKMAEGGNTWAAYDLWDAYYRGHNGIQGDPVKADKWLGEVVQDLWVVRFEPVGDFAPKNPREFLGRINQHSSARSGRTKIGAASFFRTTRQGDKLVGSFLSNYPDQLKASLTKVPGLKVTSAERITAEKFVSYEQSRQESLTDANESVLDDLVQERIKNDFGDRATLTKALEARGISYETFRQQIKERLIKEQFGDKSPTLSAGTGSTPPRIIATSPSIGATDVDPALAEITVTFDQDMGGGMSWTGGGPEFPPSRQGQKAQWRNKRTCVLPVKVGSRTLLSGGHQLDQL